MTAGITRTYCFGLETNSDGIKTVLMDFLDDFPSRAITFCLFLHLALWLFSMYQLRGQEPPR